MLRRTAMRLSLACLLIAPACSVVFDGDLGPAIACEDEGAYGPPACPMGETCRSGGCAATGAPIGTTCNSHGDCAGGFCLDPKDVGQEGTKRCSSTCCASTDCGAARDGQVCWSPPGGAGSLCFPGDDAGRGALGEARGGEGCGGDGDCRSGLCDGGKCIDTCCGDANCPPEQTCRVKLVERFAPQEAWACGLPGSMALGDMCDTADDCPSAKCVEMPPQMMPSVCAEPCCSSKACGEAQIDMTHVRIACTEIDGLRSCGKVLPLDATDGVGSKCSAGDSCRSGQCLDGICSDLCCDDASCGDVSVFSCRPAPLDGVWALRCVPK